MNKYITLAALLAAGTTLANAGTVEWDATKKQYLITEDSWSDGALTLGGDGFNLSESNWEIELSLNAVAGTGTNSWGTAPFATGTNALADFYKEGFQCYVKVGGAVVMKGNGIDETSYGKELATLSSTTEVTPLTFKIVREEGNTIYSLLSGGTSLFQETYEINDWTGKLTSLSTSITANQISSGWTYATGSLTVIPEPSAFGLLAGLGALALVGTRRRRK